MDHPANTQDTTVDSRTYEGLAAFRYALRQFLAFSGAAASAAGVTSHQYQVLLIIRAHPGGAIIIRDLAEQMLVQHHSAVQMVDRLVSARLVERRESASDRRSVLVALTAKGAKLLERLASEHFAELRRQEPLLAESLKRLRDVR
ncbi:MAG: MarR family transcriptional regulator [Bauldia sp.]